MTEAPRVIFLDAVGTLFGIRGSVGQVYGEIASKFGVHVATDVLDRAFIQSFKAAGPPAFPTPNPVEIQAHEYSWWLTIATQTFKRALVFSQFNDFSTFFAVLYAHFATDQPWQIYPDVQPALDRWRRQGIPLGILSNFDSRLYSVLDALDLTQFFTSITLSTEVGAAKPDRQIFAIALQKHACPADRAWHIGDSYTEDYQAAKAVGMRGIWLDRHF
jgi:putative hydrolase of the HAD superfamily